jgi:arylformamidase
MVIDRRGMLKGAACAAVSASFPAPAAFVQGDGGKVFLDYTQEELDRAYDQAVWAPDQDALIARYGTRSMATRQRFKLKSAIAYGPTEDEVLDIFPADETPAPIHVFVHGGAWRGGSKDIYSFPAETFVPAGAAYVALNFANIPKRRLPGMVEQIRGAIAWVYGNAASFGGDPERIYISGHSSGGHLAAVLLTTDWAALNLPRDVIKGGVCASGIYDMHPAMLSSRRNYVTLSLEEEEAALSPQRHLDLVRCPIGVVHGTRESPEFQRQARDFAAALASGGYRHEFAVLDGLNHFEVCDSLADPHSALSQMALRQMGLSPA